MNWTTSKTLGGGRVAAVLTLTGVLLTAAGGSDWRSHRRIPRRDLAGTWAVQVTLRDCVTNAAARRAVQFAGLIS